MMVCMKIMTVMVLIAMMPLRVLSAPLSGDYFTGEEMEILQGTAKSIGFDYGYDFDMNLTYIFTNSFNKDDSGEKIKKFSGVPDKTTKKNLIAFYEKVVKLKEITSLKMERFREKEIWKNYTFINKYLLPYLERYLRYLENGVLDGDPAYKSSLADRKKLLAEEARQFVRNDEIKEKIKNMDKNRRRRWKI